MKEIDNNIITIIIINPFPPTAEYTSLFYLAHQPFRSCAGLIYCLYNVIQPANPMVYPVIALYSAAAIL